MIEVSPSRQQPLSVSRLTQHIKGVLESRFPRLWVVGEISNFKRAGSGHWYFSLKDERCQIRCNMWRSYTHQVAFQPRDGTEVLVSGSLNVYPPRGEYNLIVEHMEEMGLGRLKIEFEKLKAKLKAEGLFDPAHKQPLPFLPRKIGLITSPTGAAVRDILRVLRHRFPGVHVVIFPARVQGDGAAAEIAAGIEFLDHWGDCDVLIAGRGGGSELDLWSFNEEVVARAIFAAKTPIVSAVGHEVDFTIADFVADVRAATPSNAAEIVVKSRDEYRGMIAVHQKALDRAMQRKFLVWKTRIHVSESHPIFVRVRSRVNDGQRRLAELEYQLNRRVTEILKQREVRLLRTRESLNMKRLQSVLQVLTHRLESAAAELSRQILERVQASRLELAALANRLEDLSPLKVLGRGYAAVYNQKNRVVRGPEDVRFGEIIRIQLARGNLNARVVEKAVRAVQTSLFEEESEA